MSEDLKLLELNDGWTQIPPKQDGQYWFQHAKPWRSEGAYDDPMLIQVKDGKAEAYMESGDTKWTPYRNYENNNLVWDPENQSHMLAVWRLCQPGESFENLPPPVTLRIAERLPSECSQCKGVGAVYEIYGETLESPRKYPFVCYACGHTELRAGFYTTSRAHV